MAKRKICKDCRRIYDGEKCPNCDSTNFADSFKGRIIVRVPEKSAIAKELKINKKGTYAIKT